MSHRETDGCIWYVYSEEVIGTVGRNRMTFKVWKGMCYDLVMSPFTMTIISVDFVR